MKVLGDNLFSRSTETLEASLNHRLQRQKIIVSNIANAMTPGYRALGYDFESQLQKSIESSKRGAMAATDARHLKGQGVSGDGSIKPDVHVKPTESVGNDGNTVDVDREMSELAENQILYNFTIEVLNRRLAMLRYGINGG